MKRLLLALVVIAALVAASTATASPRSHHVVGPDGWPSPWDGWIGPDEGIEIPVVGGDGGTCSLSDVIDGYCDPGDIGINPCYLRGCGGDEGTGEVCYNDFFVIRCRDTTAVPPDGDGNPNHSFVEDSAPNDETAEYVQCPGADSPAYDPNNEACW